MCVWAFFGWGGRRGAFWIDRSWAASVDCWIQPLILHWDLQKIHKRKHQYCYCWRVWICLNTLTVFSEFSQRLIAMKTTQVLDYILCPGPKQANKNSTDFKNVQTCHQSTKENSQKTTKTIQKPTKTLNLPTHKKKHISFFRPKKKKLFPPPHHLPPPPATQGTPRSPLVPHESRPRKPSRYLRSPRRLSTAPARNRPQQQGLGRSTCLEVFVFFFKWFFGVFGFFGGSLKLWPPSWCFFGFHVFLVLEYGSWDRWCY